MTLHLQVKNKAVLFFWFHDSILDRVRQGDEADVRILDPLIIHHQVGSNVSLLPAMLMQSLGEGPKSFRAAD